MKQTKRYSAIFFILFLLFSSCGVQEEQMERPVPVVTLFAETSPISREAYANARLEGIEEAIIYPAMPGRIEEVLVSIGDSVETGQHLVRLDTDQQTSAGTSAAIASISAARANAENAHRDYERLTALFEAGAISEQQLDGARVGAEAAQAQLDQAYAGYSQARSIRDNAYIEAPFSGRIGRIWARAGNTAGNEPLLSISSTAGIVTKILLPERDLLDLETGLPAYISVTAYDGRSYPGMVTAVSSSVDPLSGLVPVEVQFDNPGGDLRPGMTGRVSVLTETVEESIVVQENALRRTRTGYELAVVEDGSAVIKEVETGIRNAGMVQIVSGIEVGDELIVEGQTRVTDGTIVEVVEQ